MKNIFQVALTDEELRKVTGGSGISNISTSGSSSFSTNNINYTSSQGSGSAQNFPNSVYGGISGYSGYDAPNNTYFSSLGGGVGGQ